MGKKSIGLGLLLTILFFFSFLLCLKNKLFYDYELQEARRFDSSIMENCVFKSGNWFSNGDGAVIVLNKLHNKVNDVRVVFDKGIDEPISVYLYISTGANEQLIASREVRKGYSCVQFDFEDVEVDALRVVICDKNNCESAAIPDGKIELRERTFAPVKADIEWSIIVLLVFLASAILATLITIKKNKVEVAVAQRESNIELLRVISMLLLVGHHLAVHGGELAQDVHSLNHKLGLVFLPIGKICFISFIAITMWFLTDSSPKGERFLKAWGQVFFYSIVLTGVAYLFGANISLIDFVSSMFVMIGNSHGYASSYLIFLLLFPFIRKATCDLTTKQARYLLVVLIWIQVFSQIMRYLTGYNQPVYSEVTLFIMCYMLSLNMKRWPGRKYKPVFYLLIVLIIYFTLLVVDFYAYRGMQIPLVSLITKITVDESSVLYIIAGYALFFFFKNIKIQHSNIVNTIARYTFGVLLIHDHNFLRHVFWNDILRTQTWFHSTHAVLYYATTVVTVFIVCIVIDYVRAELMEKFWVSSKLYRYILSFFKSIEVTGDQYNGTSGKHKEI